MNYATILKLDHYLIQKSWADYWRLHPDHHKAMTALGKAAHDMGIHAGRMTMPTNAERQAHSDTLDHAKSVMGEAKAKALSDSAHKTGSKFGNDIEKYNAALKKGKFVSEPSAHPYPHRPDIKSSSIPLHGQRYGHYHEKTDSELRHVIQDAGEAEVAMRGHDSVAEGKYADQRFAGHDILRWRGQNGITK